MSDETRQQNGKDEAAASGRGTPAASDVPQMSDVSPASDATSSTQSYAGPLTQDFAVQRRRMLTAHLIAFAAMFVAFLYLQSSFFDWPAWVEWLTWRAYPDNSIALNEAIAWWSGHLQLPIRLWDTALVPGSGEVYNIFPPMQTMLWFVCTAIPSWRAAPSSIPGIVPFIIFGLPLLVVAYAVFADQVKRPKWAGVLTLSLLCGTAISPCFAFMRVSYVFHTAHLLSQVGLLLLANEVMGRRRIWLMGLGLAIAVWSRQLAVFYAVAMLYAAWKGPVDVGKVRASGESDAAASEHDAGDGDAWASSRTVEARKQQARRRLAWAMLAICIVGAVPAGLNWAKFGSPFDSGYRLIYEERDDSFANEMRENGLFNLCYIPRNFIFMNTSVPRIVEVDGGTAIAPSPNGTSIWLTTPLLAFAVVGAFMVRPEKGAWLLMACSVPVIIAILCYHATGATQVGYYRFALDFIPVWMVAGASWCASGWRRYATVVCTLWSLKYFTVFTWPLLS